MYVSKIPQSFFRQPLRHQGTAGHIGAQQGTEEQSLALGCLAKSLSSLGFGTFSAKVDLAEGGCV